MLYFSHFSSSNIYYFVFSFQNLVIDASLDCPQFHNSLFYSISYTRTARWQNISTILNNFSLTHLKVGHTDLIFIPLVSLQKIKWNWCIIRPNRFIITTIKTFFFFFETLLIDASFAWRLLLFLYDFFH